MQASRGDLYVRPWAACVSCNARDYLGRQWRLLVLLHMHRHWSCRSYQRIQSSCLEILIGLTLLHSFVPI